MNKIGIVFPGQGSQETGMGKSLSENFEIGKTIFKKANDILGFDIKNTCFSGTAEELKKTEITQPALFVVGMIAWEIFKQKTNNIEDKIVAFAGHSLGEYTAYCASGYLSFEDGLKSVRKRGLLMSEADPEGKGTMASILKLEENKVEEICKEASSVGVVVPANFNSNGQIVISGEKEAIKKAIELTKEKNGRAIPLVVGGAFHSPLMKPASDKLNSFLNEITINKSDKKVISNVYADIVEHNDIKDSLVKQLTSPVRWTESMKKMTELGVNTIIEIGSGKVLQGLMKRIDANMKCLGISDIESLDKALEVLND